MPVNQAVPEVYSHMELQCDCRAEYNRFLSFVEDPVKLWEPPSAKPILHFLNDELNIISGIRPANDVELARFIT